MVVTFLVVDDRYEDNIQDSCKTRDRGEGEGEKGERKSNGKKIYKANSKNAK